MNTFITETDSNYVRLQAYKTISVLFVVLSLLACLGFLIAWQTFLFIEFVVLVSCVITLIQKNTPHHYLLEFKGTKLYITDKANGKVYEALDVPASAYVTNQTKQEIKKDYCSLEIKNTEFAFGGVKNCSQLKRYISDHYD